MSGLVLRDDVRAKTRLLETSNIKPMHVCTYILYHNFIFLKDFQIYFLANQSSHWHVPTGEDCWNGKRHQIIDINKFEGKKFQFQPLLG